MNQIKYVIIALISLFFVTGLQGQSVKFLENMNLICISSSNCKKEVNDSENIADKVFEFVYSESYPLQEKLDLLHYLILNQEHTTRYYRSKVVYYMNENPLSNYSEPKFILPLMFCNYCDKIEVDYNIFNKIKLNSLPQMYKSEYIKLISYLNQFDKNKQSVYIKSNLKEYKISDIFNTYISIYYPKFVINCD